MKRAGVEGYFGVLVRFAPAREVERSRFEPISMASRDFGRVEIVLLPRSRYGGK